jgi:Kef-type K+ transport system membrane component KefB/mannitol/fructose-specific phosphotransferase system IIA component (Ntr-type)
VIVQDGGQTAVEATRLLFGLAVLLLAARGLGEIAQRWGQPSVLGELLAGILLGPALCGRLAPGLSEYLFPSAGPTHAVLEGLRTLAVALFLMVAGLEVDLSTAFQRGRAALSVSFAGIAAPFVLGLAVALAVPHFVGLESGDHPRFFALFFATALSISALPVIAKTMMDLYLYKTEFGMTVIAAAILNDLVGWMIFAALLGSTRSSATSEIAGIAALTIGFTGLALTAGRWAIHRVLPWIQAHTSWPAGVIGFSIVLALLGAGVTDWIGIHAVFGAFIAGVALGDSSHLRQQTRATISEFVSSFFAPLFFGSIGLTVDFLTHFDLLLCLVVLAIACLGKVLGCSAGARLAGVTPTESWAIGFALNARGMMEIILGLTALRAGLIGERMFVALVVMALVTSLMSGPAIRRILGRAQPRRFAPLLSPRVFLNPLLERERRGAIRELSEAIASVHGLDADAVDASVWEREQLGSTGMGQGLAIPHARLAGISEPLLALGLSPPGIDFNAADGELARVVFLILTPHGVPGDEIELLADIGRTFDDRDFAARLLQVSSFTELLALLRTRQATHALP